MALDTGGQSHCQVSLHTHKALLSASLLEQCQAHPQAEAILPERVQGGSYAGWLSESSF